MDHNRVRLHKESDWFSLSTVATEPKLLLNDRPYKRGQKHDNIIGNLLAATATSNNRKTLYIVPTRIIKSKWPFPTKKPADGPDNQRDILAKSVNKLGRKSQTNKETGEAQKTKEVITSSSTGMAQSKPSSKDNTVRKSSKSADYGPLDRIIIPSFWLSSSHNFAQSGRQSSLFLFNIYQSPTLAFFVLSNN